MRISLEKYISKPGNKINEDCISFGENYGLLLDGSTGLRKGIIKGEISDAAWFVENFKDIIVRDINKDGSLGEIIKNGIKEMKVKLKLLGFSNIDKVDKPSASIVVIRQLQDTLEIFSLGDCTILIETSDLIFRTM